MPVVVFFVFFFIVIDFAAPNLLEELYLPPVTDMSHAFSRSVTLV